MAGGPTGGAGAAATAGGAGALEVAAAAGDGAAASDGAANGGARAGGGAANGGARAADGAPAFRLENVARRFGRGPGGRAALEGVSLEIGRGEFVALRGPSGAGKSTLLSIMGALDRGYEGRVALFGDDLARLGEAALGRLRNERLGFVFQAFHLLPHLSVWENVAAPFLFAPGGGHGRGARVAAERALDRVGLLARAADGPNELSGGQRQRVALARAIVRRPEALLCDEPTGNLDSATGRDVSGLLTSLNRDEKMTVVVATHEPELARAARRRLELVDGRITGDEAARP